MSRKGRGQNAARARASAFFLVEARGSAVSSGNETGRRAGRWPKFLPT
jgi:hypothetical protein